MMKMRVERLRQALELAHPVIPRKTTLPVTENLLLKDGSAIATDFEKCLVLSLPEATGALLVPERPVLELLKNVPGNEELTIEYKDKEIQLSWDGGSAAYDVADPKEFPPIPKFKVKAEGELDGDLLVNRLVAMATYTAIGSTRAILNGVAVNLGLQVTLAAGDGFRMGYEELPVVFPIEKERVISIPTATVSVLADIWKKMPAAPMGGPTMLGQILGKRKFKLTLDGDKAGVEFGRVYLIMKLIEGTPPNFKALIPQPVNRVKVLAPDFERALKRIKEVAKDNSAIARLKWADGVIILSAAAAEKGSVEVKIPALTDDGPGRTALNVIYLLDYFSRKEDYVTVGIGSADSSPVVFSYRNFPTVVIMPMVVQW